MSENDNLPVVRVTCAGNQFTDAFEWENQEMEIDSATGTVSTADFKFSIDIGLKLINGGTEVQAWAKSTEISVDKMDAALVPDKSAELGPQLESIKKKAQETMQKDLNRIAKTKALVVFEELNKVLAKNTYDLSPSFSMHFNPVSIKLKGEDALVIGFNTDVKYKKTAELPKKDVFTI